MKKESIQDALKLIEAKKLDQIIICNSGHIFLSEAKNLAEDYCRRNRLTMRIYTKNELEELLKSLEEDQPTEKIIKKK